MWTFGRFQVSESNVLLLYCSNPRKTEEEKQCWNILVHSSSSVLWHKISAQGSFKTSCSTKRGRKQTKSKMWNIFKCSLHVFLFTVGELPKYHYTSSLTNSSLYREFIQLGVHENTDLDLRTVALGVKAHQIKMQKSIIWHLILFL